MILGDNKRKTYSRDWPRRFYDISTERKPLVDNRLKAKLPNINHTYSSFSKISRLVFENRTSRLVRYEYQSDNFNLSHRCLKVNRIQRSKPDWNLYMLLVRDDFAE